MSALLIFLGGISILVIATIFYEKSRNKKRVKLPGTPHVPTQGELEQGNSPYVLVLFTNKDTIPQTITWENRGGQIETKVLEVGEEYTMCAKRGSYSGSFTWILSEC